MPIDRSGTARSVRAPEAGFTGDVMISGYFRRAAPSRLAGATVTFAPGSRTPWKVNPFGQTLVVMSGVGWAQSEHQAIAEIRAGDVLWYPPGQLHWEGATPDQAMVCLVVQEETDGHAVAFGRTVTNAEYRQGPPAR